MVINTWINLKIMWLIIITIKKTPTLVKINGYTGHSYRISIMICVQHYVHMYNKMCICSAFIRWYLCAALCAALCAMYVQHYVQYMCSIMCNICAALCAIYVQHYVQYMCSIMCNICTALCAIYVQHYVQYMCSIMCNICAALCTYTEHPTRGTYLQHCPTIK